MKKSKSEIGRDLRFSLLLIPWMTVVVLTFPGAFMFPQFFPAGFLRVFRVKETDAIDHSWVVVGWAVYFLLTAGACLSGQKRNYFIIYGILCILLALNIAGCRAFLSDLRDVH